MDKAEAFYKLFPCSLREHLQARNYCFQEMREIRIRVGQPVLIKSSTREEALRYKNSTQIYIMEQSGLEELINYICDFSIYAYEEELKQGFMTTIGGHRIGIGGSVVTEDHHVKTFRYITCLNIRIAHELPGIGEKILPYLQEDRHVCNTLLVSAPGCGKTTMLRDLVRLLSNGGYTLGVVDERSEIGGCYMGIPQNDIGMRTDVIECCAKEQGIMMLLRSMSPDVIAVDEIGTRADVEAIQNALRSGCRLIATVHGYDITDVIEKKQLSDLISDGVIERFILLEHRCTGERVIRVLDRMYNCLLRYREEAS